MKRHERKAAKRQEREAKAKALRTAHAQKKTEQRVALRKPLPRPVSPPPAVQAVVRAQLERFKAYFGRPPHVGEPLFFDHRVAPIEGPQPLPSADEGLIHETADALRADPALVATLVRSGLMVRSGPNVPASGVALE